MYYGLQSEIKLSYLILQIIILQDDYKNEIIKNILHRIKPFHHI